MNRRKMAQLNVCHKCGVIIQEGTRHLVGCPSLDACPRCGRHIFDNDPLGVERHNGQRWCRDHWSTWDKIGFKP